jgi:hypothetical protein
VIDLAVLRDARLQVEASARLLLKAEKFFRHAKAGDMSDSRLEQFLHPIISEAKTLLDAAEARLK